MRGADTFSAARFLRCPRKIDNIPLVQTSLLMRTMDSRDKIKGAAGSNTAGCRKESMVVRSGDALRAKWPHAHSTGDGGVQVVWRQYVACGDPAGQRRWCYGSRSFERTGVDRASWKPSERAGLGIRSNYWIWDAAKD